jgi:glutamyl endopeptidase
MNEQHEGSKLNLGKEEKKAMEKVINNDDRQAVPNGSMMPWRAICALRITAANGASLLGTGFMVTDRAVVTAAHNVFDRDRGGRALDITVIPALDGLSKPFGEQNMVSADMPPDWITSAREGSDYAVMTLAGPLTAGTLSCAVLASAVVPVTPLIVSGYPRDKDSGTRQYFHQSLATVAADLFTYKIDTEEGQSGSPIIANIPVPTVVGVHVEGTAVLNFGVRFTTAAITNIRAWAGL